MYLQKPVKKSREELRKEKQEEEKRLFEVRKKKYMYLSSF